MTEEKKRFLDALRRAEEDLKAFLERQAPNAAAG